jgi:hypothetical protein
LRYRHVAGAASAALLASVALAAGPASAQEEEPLAPLAVAPTSGPAGTVISVSGDGCLLQEGQEGLIPTGDAVLLRIDDAVTDDDVVAENIVAAAPDGTWSTSLTVPEGLDPEAVYVVAAVCFGVAEPVENTVVLVEYEPILFDVLGSPTEPPVTPPDVEIPPVEIDPPAAAPAPAARAVRAQPTFTG